MTYQRRASPLHAARAAAGALFCLALAAGALLEHPLLLAAVAAAVLISAAGAGVLPGIGRAARYAVPLAVLFALINPFVVRQGLTVFARLGEVPPFGQVDLTVEALLYGLILGGRIVVVILAFALFTACVDPDELLKLFRRVSFRSALTAALATRLVPVLARDAKRLDLARRCRADGGGTGNAARVAVLRAVSTGALDRAIDVAATLEVRGYGTTHRGRHDPRPWSRHDLAFLAAALGLIALLIGSAVLGVGSFEAYPLLSVPMGPGEFALAGSDRRRQRPAVPRPPRHRAMSVLVAEGLTYTYAGATVPALSDVTFAVEPGEFVVLAGDSASGKSTLLRAASGLVPHFHGGRISGRVTVGGLDTRDHGPAELSAVAGSLFQDPESQTVLGTVRAELAFPLENRGHGPAAVARGVEEAALALGIEGLLDRSTHELSGGELAARRARRRPGGTTPRGPARRAHVAARPGRR